MGKKASPRSFRQEYNLGWSTPSLSADEARAEFGAGPIRGRALDLARERCLTSGRLDDLELEDCVVKGFLRPPDHPSPGSASWFESRPRVRNLRVRDSAWYSDCKGIVFDECVFDGLHTRVKGPLRISSCSFRRTVLRGFIGWLWMTDDGVLPDEPPIDIRAARDFYRDVDWALDLSEAETAWIDVDCIPVDKIRRNPELHGILRRERADVDAMRAVEGVGYTMFPDDALRLLRTNREAGS